MIETPCRDVPLEGWTAAMTEARSEGFDFFDWLTAVDQSDAPEDPGFDIVCHLMNSSTGHLSQGGLARVLVRTRVPIGQSAASVTGLWPGSAWHERETYEMFGIDFAGFDDGTGLGLRPLLLPNGFEGNPLRKSFVLASRASKAWPGGKEPGEGGDGGGESGAASGHTEKPGRRKVAPPGVPDSSWGPR